MTQESLILIASMCAAAVLGRLVLTVEGIRRLFMVRLPAVLLLLLIVVPFLTLLGGVWLAMCFIGGSFYGIKEWFCPPAWEVVEGLDWLWRPIRYGEWKEVGQ